MINANYGWYHPRKNDNCLLKTWPSKSCSAWRLLGADVWALFWVFQRLLSQPTTFGRANPMHKSSESHFLIFSVDQKSSKFSCASSSNFPMFIASTPAVRVVLNMGGTPMIHVIDPFSSGQRAMGWGWLGYAEQVKCQTRFRQEKYTPNSISFSYFSSQRITWLLSRIHYSSYYFCHFWVDCLTGNHWFPRGFPLVAHLSGSSAASAASARRSAASVRSWRQKGAPHGERQRSGPSCCSNSPGAPWFWAFGYTIMKKPWALGLFSRIWMFNWSKFFRVGSAY